MDPYQGIAEYYDDEHADFDDDVQWYSNLVTEGPVLEVGCGTGRLMQPLLARGLEVWGVDPSQAMLDRARTRLASMQKSHVVCTTLEDMALDRQFATAILPLNTLWHLSSLDEQISGLHNLRKHLHPGSLLLVDLTNPLTMADRGSSGEVRQRFSCPKGEGELTSFSAAWDDRTQQLLSLDLWYDDTRPDGQVSRRRSSLLLRYLYRGELELLLLHCGFRVREIYGSYDLEEYHSGSPNILVVASAE